MLIRLSIRDIVLIERLDIDFTSGLSVLTGETGAGKSILLDSLALALGGRSSGGLVRQGTPQGQVTAAFDVPAGHPARVLLRANDIPADDDLLLRRVQFADGRTRAFLNDQPVAVQVLRSVGGALVEIHGQHDDRALVDTATHRRLLDAYGGLEEEAAGVAGLWTLRRDAEQRVALHRADVERARREADWLRHAAGELGTLAPEPGEETALAERRAGMVSAQKVADDLRDVRAVVSGGASAVPALAAAVRRLERRQVEAPALIEPAVQALDAALTALDEAGLHIDRALAAAAADPHELERIEERLFALRAASRKYNVPVDRLAALRAQYAGDLALIDAGTSHLNDLERAAAAAAGHYEQAAAALSRGRRDAALLLEQAVSREVRPLRLEQAQFQVAISSPTAVPGPEGVDRVEFFARTNPGTAPGPLMKVASGGELSRFMLALKVVIADRGSAPSLVFDEIDAGAGGAVADAIGMRLSRLAARVQVLAVTHAPQVAARADHHYLIAKEAPAIAKDAPADLRPVTRITRLAPELRREEIARMLAGAEVTREARAAAERLMKAAAR